MKLSNIAQTNSNSQFYLDYFLKLVTNTSSKNDIKELTSITNTNLNIPDCNNLDTDLVIDTVSQNLDTAIDIKIEITKTYSHYIYNITMYLLEELFSPLSVIIELWLRFF